MIKNYVKGLVSIIMPTFNCAKYLSEAIDSVLAQTYKNWELIIVNDGSTDNTNKIFTNYSDQRIVFHDFKKNLGRGASRKFAVEKSKGEYIAIFDADDISDDNRLKLQVEYLESNKSIDILSSQILHFTDEISPTQFNTFPTNASDIRKKINSGKMGIPHCASIFRHKCIEICGNYDPKVGNGVEDIELFIRFNKIFRMVTLKDFLVFYRKKPIPESLTNLLVLDKYNKYANYVANKKLINENNILEFGQWAFTYKIKFSDLIHQTIYYFYMRLKLIIKKYNLTRM